MALSRIAQQVRDFLEQYSNENPDRYYAALGTKFIEFIDFSERALFGLNKRLKKVEDDQAEIMAILKDAAEAAQTRATQPVNGEAPPAVKGAAPAARPQQRVNDRNMVRVGGDGVAMTPEEQAAEEQADLTLHGEIDTSRYVPRGSVPNPGEAPPA